MGARINYIERFGENAELVFALREKLVEVLQPIMGTAEFRKQLDPTIAREMAYAGLGDVKGLALFLHHSLHARQGCVMDRATKEGKLFPPVRRVPVSIPPPPPPSPDQAFYDSPQWRRVRYTALARSKGCCELCGAVPVVGKPMHVDHVKPRSKYPALALEINNLQVLCVDCNMGKSARTEDDWRAPRTGERVRDEKINPKPEEKPVLPRKYLADLLPGLRYAVSRLRRDCTRSGAHMLEFDIKQIEAGEIPEFLRCGT